MSKEQEQPIQKELYQLMNDIGQILGKALREHTKELGEPYGFALLMFQMTPGGRMNYISNSVREDMIAAMKEFISKMEGTYVERTGTRVS